MCWIKSPGRSAILCGEIEGKDPIHSVWALQHLRMAKRANRIVVAAFQCSSIVRRELLVIFGATFVILGVVDQLCRIVDFLVHGLRSLSAFGDCGRSLGST